VLQVGLGQQTDGFLENLVYERVDRPEVAGSRSAGERLRGLGEVLQGDPDGGGSRVGGERSVLHVPAESDRGDGEPQPAAVEPDAFEKGQQPDRSLRVHLVGEGETGQPVPYHVRAVDVGLAQHLLGRSPQSRVDVRAEHRVGELGDGHAVAQQAQRVEAGGASRGLEGEVAGRREGVLAGGRDVGEVEQDLRLPRRVGREPGRFEHRRRPETVEEDVEQAS